MHLFTAEGFQGEIGPCDEGTLEWISKSHLRALNLWEGDHIFLDLLEADAPFFTMKLEYEGDRLIRAKLGNRIISLPYRGLDTLKGLMAGL